MAYEIRTQPSTVTAVPSTTATRRPGALAAVVLTVLLIGGAWLAHLLQVTRTPAQDNLEQLLWVQSLQWGYYKHPPLPTWLLWPAVALFGDGDAVPATLGALCALGSLLLAWRLWQEMGLGRLATIALLATLCNSYYSARLDVWNHNVVLLPFVTASAWATWVAFHRRSIAAWAALGVALGLGLLAKYQMVLVVGCVAVVWVHQRGWAQAVHRRGPWLAAAAAALVFAPHGLWLVQNGFPPFDYAVQSSLGAGLEPGRRGLQATVWLGDQLLNRALPSLLMLSLLLGWLWVRGRHARPAAAAPVVPGLARAVVLAWGLLPLATMVGIGLVTGALMQKHWGHGFMAFTAAAGVLLVPQVAWHALPWRVVWLACAAVQVLALSHHAWTFDGGSRADGRPRHTWRLQQLQPAAAAIDMAAREALGHGAPMVRGPQSLAVAVARAMPVRPWVRIDGPLAWSPWVDSDAARGCPTLWLGVPPQPQDRVLARGRHDGIAWTLVRARHPELGCAWRDPRSGGSPTPPDQP